MLPADEPPREELERRLAERRRMDAQAFPVLVTQALAVTFGALQALALVLYLGSLALHGRSFLKYFTGQILHMAGDAFWVSSALPAALAAAAVVIFWSNLSRQHVACGLVPWIGFLAEATPHLWN